MIESDLSGAQEGRTLRLFSRVLVEWMQNHEKATWSTLVHALSSIGNRSAARRIAHEYGMCMYDAIRMSHIDISGKEILLGEWLL